MYSSNTYNIQVHFKKYVLNFKTHVLNFKTYVLNFKTYVLNFKTHVLNFKTHEPKPPFETTIYGTVKKFVPSLGRFLGCSTLRVQHVETQTTHVYKTSVYSIQKHNTKETCSACFYTFTSGNIKIPVQQRVLENCIINFTILSCSGKLLFTGMTALFRFYKLKCVKFNVHSFCCQQRCKCFQNGYR